MRRIQRDGDKPVRESHYLYGRRARKEPSGASAESAAPNTGPVTSDACRSPETIEDENLRISPPKTGPVPDSEGQPEVETQVSSSQASAHPGGQDLVTATGFGELARAYVPVQMYGRILPPEEGFHRGTIFAELVRTPPLYQRLD